MVTYKNFMKFNEKYGYNKDRVKKKAGLSSNTFTKLSRDGMVSFDVLV